MARRKETIPLLGMARRKETIPLLGMVRREQTIPPLARGARGVLPLNILGLCNLPTQHATNASVRLSTLKSSSSNSTRTPLRINSAKSSFGTIKHSVYKRPLPILRIS